MDASSFMPHGMCYLWRPDILGLHVVSDALIAISYFSIPLALIYFVRHREDLEQHFLFVCFAIFIVSCGGTHLLEIWTIWHPDYWLSGTVKAITALASACTAVLLIRAVPVALRLPSPRALQLANERLQAENRERQRIESEMVQMNGRLEMLVVQRTAALEAANTRLTAEVEQRVRAESLLRALIQQVPVSFALFDTDLRHLVVSGKWLTDVVGEKANPIGHTLDAVLPGMSDAWHTMAQRALQGERMRIAEDKWIRHDGAVRWYDWESRPWMDDREHIAGVIVFGLDITDRKQAEERARTSNSGFRTLADNLPQIIWTADARGHYDYISRQWEAYTGLSSAEGLGDLWLQQIHEDDRNGLLDCFVQDAEKAPKDARVEFRLRRHDGKYRWFAMRCAALLDESGRIDGWCGATTDVHDQKHASEVQARVQKMEALGTLAGGIAHDFNNIISAIAGNATLAAEDVAKDSPADRSLREIMHASRRATDIVRRILAFSRQEPSGLEPLHLNEVISEAFRLLRPTLPAKIELTLEFDSPSATVLADATQIHQVVVNLTTNAVHAIGDRPGHVRLRVHRETIDESQSTPLLKSGAYVCLSVEDDGDGMDQATMMRIFDPFFTTKATGTGLGLSVVDGIMKSHKGAVTVHSELGRGTTFTLYLPAVQALPTSPPSGNRVPLTKVNGQHILYVDDDAALVSITTRRLQRLGFRTTGLTDAKSAVEMFKQHPEAFDAVVTDLSMPQMSGFDLAQALKAIRNDVPVFVTSGYITDADHRRASSLGIAKLLEKPGTVEVLCAELERIFNAAQS